MQLIDGQYENGFVGQGESDLYVFSFTPDQIQNGLRQVVEVSLTPWSESCLQIDPRPQLQLRACARLWLASRTSHPPHALPCRAVPPLQWATPTCL